MNAFRIVLLAALTSTTLALAANPAHACDTGKAVAVADQASYPTIWYGPVPPVPPCGYYWAFIGHDVYGVAIWRLTRLF